MPETTSQYDAVTERVLSLAQEEARGFNHPYIGAEHLVLAMLSEGKGAAATALGENGITLSRFRAGVEMAGDARHRRRLPTGLQCQLDT